MSEIRTVLADGAVAVRNTIAQLLALEPDIDVLGEYGDGHLTLGAVRELRPDVAVLAVDLPGLDGIAVAEAIADTDTRVLILSSITASGTCRTAMRAGALGYVARTAPSYRLVAAVRATAAGERFVDLDIVDEDTVADLAGDRTGRATPLTTRERRVLSAASRCRSTRELCETVGLPQEIVGMVMCTLLAKTGGQDRLDAARIATARGWI
ncbi:MAG TPA: response regulator transcription factor [Pseudonocardiaceae bacterium]|jgi:two-component system response regulator DesR